MLERGNFFFRCIRLLNECKFKCLFFYSSFEQIYDALGEFALYILDEFDIKNSLHVQITKDLVRFILNLTRTKFQTRNSLGYTRFSYFVQKMSLKLKYYYLDYLCG